MAQGGEALLCRVVILAGEGEQREALLRLQVTRRVFADFAKQRRRHVFLVGTLGGVGDEKEVAVEVNAVRVQDFAEGLQRCRIVTG